MRDKLIYESPYVEIVSFEHKNTVMTNGGYEYKDGDLVKGVSQLETDSTFVDI